MSEEKMQSERIVLDLEKGELDVINQINQDIQQKYMIAGMAFEQALIEISGIPELRKTLEQTYIARINRSGHAGRIQNVDKESEPGKLILYLKPESKKENQEGKNEQGLNSST